MSQINNQTEKEYRDRQTNFGHMHKSLNLNGWLEQTYHKDVIRRNRYYKISEKFLGGNEKLTTLELAAGVGDFVCFSMQSFPLHTYYANELSEIQLKGNICEVATFFGVAETPNLSFGPVESLSYSDNMFDVIFIKAAVHHFEDPHLGFREMYRILKPRGRVVFFEDPVCLDIPLYKDYIKNNFALAERAMGINEHIYTVSEYKSYGELFSKKDMYLDEELVAEFDRQQDHRTGIKKLVFSIVRKHGGLFHSYMVWRFSPVVFVFTK